MPPTLCARFALPPPRTTLPWRAAFLLHIFERRDRGAVDHLSVSVEARAVTRAVPALLRAVPLDDALEVRAHRTLLVQLPLLVAIRGDLLRSATNHAPF